VFAVGCRPQSERPDTAVEPQDTAPDGDPAVIEAGPIQLCDDPQLRVEEGPFVEVWGGADWRNQLEFPEGSGWDNGRGVSVADFDRDGFYDIFLPNIGRDELFMGGIGFTWEEDTEERFGVRQHRTQGSVIADVDGNGGVDLVAVNRGNPNRLYLNTGGGMFGVVDDSGFADQGSGSIGGVFADVDGDDDLDLLICAHFTGPTPEWDQEAPGPADPSELYENLGNGTFRDRSDVLSQETHDGYTYACGFHDFDDDGRPDIYLVNDFGDRVVGNQLLRNTFDGFTWNFEDVSAETGTDLAMFGMGLGLGDINGDGVVDMLVPGWDNIALLESAADGSWYEASASRGMSVNVGVSDVGWGGELEDLDNDGDLDAVVAYGYLEGDDEPGLQNPTEQQNAVWVWEGDSFQERAVEWGLADLGINRGFVVTDFNRDGFLDFVFRDLAGPAKVMFGRCDDSSWLEVSLDQVGLNPSAVGAKIEVGLGGRVLTRWVRAGGTGISSSGPQVVHFGLADKDVAPFLRVTWPDGAVSVFTDVIGRRAVKIRRL